MTKEIQIAASLSWEKFVFILFAILPALLFTQVKTRKVVLVVSIYGNDMAKLRPGFEMDEW